MFMFKPQAYLEELKKTSPEIYHAATESAQEGEEKDDYIRLNSEIFADCPNISIDYAVMEKTHKAVVIPLASSWNDLGCWTAVAKAGVCDAENNVIQWRSIDQRQRRLLYQFRRPNGCGVGFEKSNYSHHCRTWF